MSTASTPRPSRTTPTSATRTRRTFWSSSWPTSPGECSEVGMYLCMARIAHREGYPEIGLYWEKAAYEEAEHAAKFAELLGEELEPNMKAEHQGQSGLACGLRVRRHPGQGGSGRAAPRRTVWTPSTTPSTRWPAMRPATARLSRACWIATSSKKKTLTNQAIFERKHRKVLPLFLRFFAWKLVHFLYLYQPASLKTAQIYLNVVLPKTCTILCKLLVKHPQEPDCFRQEQ